MVDDLREIGPKKFEEGKDEESGGGEGRGAAAVR
jgi:hypothetical protein